MRPTHEIMGSVEKHKSTFSAHVHLTYWLFVVLIEVLLDIRTLLYESRDYLDIIKRRSG